MIVKICALIIIPSHEKMPEKPVSYPYSMLVEGFVREDRNVRHPRQIVESVEMKFIRCRGVSSSTSSASLTRLGR